MQRKIIMEIIAGLLVIMATAGVIAGVFLYEESLNRGQRTIILSARAPENGNWDLPEISLVQGEPVRFKIRNIDTVTHGFAIPELGVGINEPIEIKAGHVAIVDITPARSGTFLYMCTVWCSKSHPLMTGRIKISEK